LKIQAIKFCEHKYKRSNRRSKQEEERLNGVSSPSVANSQKFDSSKSIGQQKFDSSKSLGGDVVDLYNETKQAMTIKLIDEEVLFKEHLRAIGKLDEYLLQKEQSQ
jgi:hypothetical protein